MVNLFAVVFQAYPFHLHFKGIFKCVYLHLDFV